MISSDIIDEIISNLSPDSVPSEFVVSAKLTMIDGTDLVIDGHELEETLKNNRQNIHSYRVILDVRKIHQCINFHTEKLMLAVFGE